MKLYTKIALVPLILLSLVTSGSSLYSAEPQGALRTPERIKFHIAAVEEKAGRRNVISESTVEGPPGTDFSIRLEDGRFNLDARFLTDLIASDRLKVRASLNTSRRYGYSERGLPVYEEDAQSHTLQLGFDEVINLLPFGRGVGGDKLQIEITPLVSEQSAYIASGKPRPLEIKIIKPGPAGAISIRASKIPHNFEAEVSLVEDGREVARSVQTLLIEESQELALEPTSEASPEVLGNPLAVSLLIDEFARGRPSDQVVIRFDAFRLDGQGAGGREAVALKWAGVANLGSNIVYDISQNYPGAAGKRYELRFKIKLARGEAA